MLISKEMLWEFYSTIVINSFGESTNVLRTTTILSTYLYLTFVAMPVLCTQMCCSVKCLIYPFFSQCVLPYSFARLPPNFTGTDFFDDLYTSCDYCMYM